MYDRVPKKPRFSAACVIFLPFAALWMLLLLIQVNGEAVYYWGEAHEYKVSFQCYKSFDEYRIHQHPTVYDNFDKSDPQIYIIGNLYMPEMNDGTRCDLRLVATTGYPIQDTFMRFSAHRMLTTTMVDYPSFWTGQRRFVSAELIRENGETIHIELNRKTMGGLPF